MVYFFWNNPMEDGKKFALISREYAVKCYSDLMADAQKKHDGIQDGEWFTYDREEMSDKANQIIKLAIEDPQLDALLTAFTVAELGVMLLDGINSIKNKGFTNDWQIRHEYKTTKRPERNYGTGTTEFGITCMNEAAARADLLIYLLENKLTTPEEVNYRLGS